jgi:hypothetical protein
MVKQRGGLPVALLGACGVRRGRRGSHGGVPPGKHGDEGSLLSLAEPVKGGGLVVGAAEVAASAKRLQPDQPSEYLEVDQSVPGGEGHDFYADRVAPGGEPRPRERLHPGAVEGEGEQRRVTEAARDRLRLGRRLAGTGAGIAA